MKHIVPSGFSETRVTIQQQRGTRSTRRDPWKCKMKQHCKYMTVPVRKRRNKAPGSNSRAREAQRASRAEPRRKRSLPGLYPVSVSLVPAEPPASLNSRWAPLSGFHLPNSRARLFIRDGNIIGSEDDNPCLKRLQKKNTAACSSSREILLEISPPSEGGS